MLKKVVLIAVAAVAVLVAAAYGVHLYMDWERRQDKLPVEFTDIPVGARAPKGQAGHLGLDVGKSTVADVDAWKAQKGIECANTSMRALMQKKREDTQQKMKEAEEKGEDPDGVTGASLANYHSRKEQNPQVRLVCDGVDGSKLGHDGETGRAMIIFDSEKHPARHVSWSTKIPDRAVAVDKFHAAIAEMEKRFGPSTGNLNEDPDPNNPFPPLKVYRREWRFTDLRAEVTGISFGKRGVEVKETVEVPWPVRADAPALP